MARCIFRAGNWWPSKPPCFANRHPAGLGSDIPGPKTVERLSFRVVHLCQSSQESDLRCVGPRVHKVNGIPNGCQCVSGCSSLSRYHLGIFRLDGKVLFREQSDGQDQASCQDLVSDDTCLLKRCRNSRRRLGPNSFLVQANAQPRFQVGHES